MTRRNPLALGNSELWASGGIFDQLALERAAQDSQWGEQNHPDGTSVSLYSGTRDTVRQACDSAHEAGWCTWAQILTEEFWEALAEEDPIKLRGELIQVAAVAINWIQAIDRRGA